MCLQYIMQLLIECTYVAVPLRFDEISSHAAAVMSISFMLIDFTNSIIDLPFSSSNSSFF